MTRSKIFAMFLIVLLNAPFVAQSISAAQIDIPTKVFVALDQPDIGRGSCREGNKHTTWAFNPLNGRLYSIGGDFDSLDAGAAQSYQQTQFSLSIAERWANQADRNAGWRLEYPYCGPNGGIQPKSPRFCRMDMGFQKECLLVYARDIGNSGLRGLFGQNCKYIR